MNSDGILKILDEQSTFEFTGKINVLLNNNNQHVGAIYQVKGVIVSASYHDISGKKALFNLVFDDVEGLKDLKFIVEPEIVQSKVIQFEYHFEEFQKKAEKRFRQYNEFKHLRPPGHLKLKIRPNFVEDLNGFSVGPEEFDIVCDIINFKNIDELYKKSALYDYQITRALVSLRKKNALLVVE